VLIISPPPNYNGKKLKREEAVTLLKELIGNGLIETTWLSIEQRKPNKYQLSFKGNYQSPLLDPLLKKLNLAIEENKEKDYLVIFKP
jgi:hypothetical protein